MVRHRSRLQIIADVLKVARDGALKTHIMYGAKLSYTLLIRYLKDVVDMRLVRKEKALYMLTEKGSDFLHEFDSYRKHREGAEEQLKDVKDEKARLMNTFLNQSEDELADLTS